MNKDLMYRNEDRINLEKDNIITYIETLQENWIKLQMIDEELKDDVCLFVTNRKDFYLASKSKEYKELFEMVEPYLRRHNKFADDDKIKLLFVELYRYLFTMLGKASIKPKYKPYIYFDKSNNNFYLSEKIFDLIETENTRYCQTKKEKKIVETITNIMDNTKQLKELLNTETEYGTLKTLLGVISRKGDITYRIDEIV